MKYSWLLTLVALLAIAMFHNAIVPAKTNLAAVISLERFPQPQHVKQNGREVLVAQVYSTYPFNNRSILTVAAGSEEGIRPGMVVTADGNYLLGQVTEVFDHLSNVRTIFDKDWQISARVGSAQADALLVSGQQPSLTMIDKKIAVAEGDPVISASRDFPYGLKIGTISGIESAGEVSFQQGMLQVPYQVNDLKEVAIIIR